MAATHYNMSAGTMTPVTAPIQGWRLLALLWLRPRRAFEAIAAGPGWLWAIPMGCALALFYARFFTMALLGAPAASGALIGGLGGILGGWLLRAWLLQQISAWLGGRPDFGALYRTTAWAAFPLILRDAVQVGYMAATGNLITDPGLSHLVTEATAWVGGQLSPAGVAIAAIGRVVLGRIDFYTIWHLALLALALTITAALPRTKAGLAVALYSLASLAGGLLALLLTGSPN